MFCLLGLLRGVGKKKVSVKEKITNFFLWKSCLKRVFSSCYLGREKKASVIYQDKVSGFIDILYQARG